MYLSTLLGTVLFLAGFFLVFKCSQWFRTYYRVCKLLKPLPGVQPHWLYGNLEQKTRLTYNDDYCKWVEKEKCVISKDWLGPFKAQVNINHPELVKELFSGYKARWVYNTIEPWLGDGLLLSGGRRWARNRRLLTKAFHFEVLKPYMQVYNECTAILLDKWMERAIVSDPVLVHADISKLSLDILLQCCFSYNSNCQLVDDQQLPYIKAVRSISDLAIVKLSSVFLSLLNDTVFCNFTRTGRQFKKHIDIAHRFSERVIAERKQDLGLDSKAMQQNMEDVLWFAKRTRKYVDFLDILLTARDEDGCGLNDLEIRWEADTFLFEGHDTTSHGLTWTLYCLAKHPEHQEKCREEINNVLMGRVSSDLEYEDLPKLTYIQWCIKESLRLYPPVYSVYRQFDKDTEIGGYLIPKECVVAQKQYVIHHNSKFWPDPYVYDPLRFHPDNVKNRHPFSFIPFSAGPRNCIGQNFAMNELRVVVSNIVRKFRFSLVKEHEVVMTTKILLSFQNDVKIWLEPCSGVN